MRKTCLGWTPACSFAWLRSRAFLPRSNWLSLEKPASFILSINWCILAGIAQLCCLSFGNTIMWDEKCRCATCCISPVTRLRFPEVRQFIFFFFCPFIFSKSAAPWQAWEENVVGLFARACAGIENAVFCGRLLMDQVHVQDGMWAYICLEGQVSKGTSMGHRVPADATSHTWAWESDMQDGNKGVWWF